MRQCPAPLWRQAPPEVSHMLWFEEMGLDASFFLEALMMRSVRALAPRRARPALPPDTQYGIRTTQYQFLIRLLSGGINKEPRNPGRRAKRGPTVVEPLM